MIYITEKNQRMPVNSTDQGVVWFGATSFNTSASWFVRLSCNVLLLFSSSRGTWAEERPQVLWTFERRAFFFLFAATGGDETGGSDVCDLGIAWVRHYDQPGGRERGGLFMFFYLFGVYHTGGAVSGLSDHGPAPY